MSEIEAAMREQLLRNELSLAQAKAGLGDRYRSFADLAREFGKLKERLEEVSGQLAEMVAERDWLEFVVRDAGATAVYDASMERDGSATGGLAVYAGGVPTAYGVAVVGRAHGRVGPCRDSQESVYDVSMETEK